MRYQFGSACADRIPDIEPFALSPDTDSAIPPPSTGGGARRWLVQFPRAIPLAIFLAIAAITALSVFAIETNARARERAQMREYAQGVAAALDRSGSGFASYLRAGAALFASLDEVSPETFDNFVRVLKLNTDYSGAEGIGWIPVMERAICPPSSPAPAPASLPIPISIPPLPVLRRAGLRRWRCSRRQPRSTGGPSVMTCIPIRPAPPPWPKPS